MPEEFAFVDKALKKADLTRARFKRNLKVVSVEKQEQQVDEGMRQNQKEAAVDNLNTNNNASRSDEDLDSRLLRGSSSSTRASFAWSTSSSSRSSAAIRQRPASKFVPAHKSAPFQTVAATKRVKHAKTRSQLLREGATSKQSAVVTSHSSRNFAHRQNKTTSRPVSYVASSNFSKLFDHLEGPPRIEEKAEPVFASPERVVFSPQNAAAFVSEAELLSVQSSLSKTNLTKEIPEQSPRPSPKHPDSQSSPEKPLDYFDPLSNGFVIQSS